MMTKPKTQNARVVVRHKEIYLGTEKVLWKCSGIGMSYLYLNISICTFADNVQAQKQGSYRVGKPLGVLV